MSLGNSEILTVSENGLLFNVDWVNGQKTGFFVDQRELQTAGSILLRQKGTEPVWLYRGFLAYAMRDGLKVDTVDVSERAIEMANQNIELNFPGDSRHTGIVADAFRYLEEIDNSYDLIVLDPPAFAKHGNVLHNALQGYKRLNMKAIEKIAPGGIIFTFSCSQVVTREISGNRSLPQLQTPAAR
ncbi:MAG: class I SAM-dependent methyltransferase [Bacteroidales bacterium]